jgi:hypothetical protein
MAAPILHKSPPQDENKSDLKLDSEICPNNERNLFEPLNPKDAGYLPGIGSHFIRILNPTVSSLTRLHKGLSKIEEMLAEGGEL